MEKCRFHVLTKAFQRVVPHREMCNLILCFNGERRKRNKDIKGITDTKNAGEGGLRYELIFR